MVQAQKQIQRQQSGNIEVPSQPAQQGWSVRSYSRSTVGVFLFGAALLTLTLIGFLTSTFYTNSLGLTTAFEGESAIWWPVWGIRSLMLPIAQMGDGFSEKCDKLKQAALGPPDRPPSKIMFGPSAPGVSFRSGSPRTDAAMNIGEHGRPGGLVTVQLIQRSPARNETKTASAAFSNLALDVGKLDVGSERLCSHESSRIVDFGAALSLVL
jgi:hypothetical protein